DSISKLNKENIESETFLVWGNNNGNIVFKKDETDKESPIKKINRVWKIQKTQVNDKNEINTFLIVNDSLFSSQAESKKEDTNIWLAVSSNSSDVFDYVNANYYRGEITQEGKIIFKNIVWDKDKNGSDTFTFIKAPDLFMNYELIEQNCNLSQNGRIKVKVEGGVLPFVLNIQHNGVVTTLDKNSKEFEIETPTSGDYHLTLIDSKKQSFSQIVKTNLLDSFEAILASEWFLNEDSEVEIVPNINSKNATSNYSYQWKQDDKMISKEKTLKINETGDYILNIKNDKGCEKDFPFKVIKKNSNTNDVIVYPNPVASNEEFKIKLDLENPSSVDIKIYTINGVLLKHDKMENIVNSEYSNKLQTSGSYLIVITTNNQSITSKLIVK
ncbi:T9SS type A sorting domain-containing protein, partial [Flavobacterium sp.]